MTAASPHARIQEDWLALAEEEALDPGQPILDAHHHLWDRPESRYRTDAFLTDVGGAHDVRASIYVQCRIGYRTHGPEKMRPLGEVETVLDWSRSAPAYPAVIVAFADLQLGTGVAPVLEALRNLALGRVCGIRNTTAFHPDPRVRSNPRPPPDGRLRTDAIRLAGAELARQGLVLDVWAYQTQLSDVAALARAVPDLTVVLDHCGGPLGVGPFRDRSSEDFAAWRAALSAVADLPNTRVKIGGFGLGVFGNAYHLRDTPPGSTELASDWAPHVRACLDLFGPDRAMFESNFPVDKGMFPYATLWNVFKRLAAELLPQERDALFWCTAVRSYGIEFDAKPREGTTCADTAH